MKYLKLNKSPSTLFFLLLVAANAAACDSEAEKTKGGKAVANSEDKINEPDSLNDEQTQVDVKQKNNPNSVDAIAEQSQKNSSTSKNDSIILVPGAVSIGFTAGFTIKPLETLKDNLISAGYEDVQIAAYNNVLTVNREDIERSLIDKLKKLTKADKKYTVIAHSMGHYVALSAALNSELEGRIARLIGLAGAAKGGDEPPMGCGSSFIPLPFATKSDPEKKCPGLSGLMQGQPTYMVDKMLAKNRESLKKIKKCALAVKNDSMLSPHDSGFLPDSDNFTVSFASHADLPSHAKTVRFLQEKCGL